MGSLPNLHELSSEYVDLVAQNELLAKTFQEKGITLDSKKTHHRPLYQTRSLGSNPNSCIVSSRFQKKLTYDKSDFNSSRRCRSLRSSSVIPGHLQHVGTSSFHNVKYISRQASVSSSTGTSSVRKLIAVVRSTPSHFGPIYSRPIISQNFIALCFSHGMFTVAFVPIVILQGSISAWWISNDRQTYLSYNTGSLLLAGLYFLAAMSTLFSPFVAHKIGITKCMVSCYALAVMFVGVHLYPERYLLIPAYVVMGISVGHLNSSKVTYLIMLASKLKFVLSEEEENELQNELDSMSSKRESLAQKLFRGLSLAQNIGLIAGGIITYFIIQLTAVSNKNEKDSLSDRTCGYESCPRSGFYREETNKSANTSPVKPNLVLPLKTSTILAGVFLSFCIISMLVTIFFIHRIRINHNYGPTERSKFEHRLRAVKDTFKNPKLKFITPLLIFIGIEQGFMYADFTKLYVICVMGIQNAPLIFISLGLLQAIAGFTLSLLVHHIRRYFIIGVGFVFQACLLLVLILWKPTRDDSALFYVISATWGVCNAIWDSVTFCFLVSLFSDFWEFPFSHHFFFRYVGLFVAFAYHSFLCTSVKLYIMCAMLLLAVFPYILLEMKLDTRSRSLVPTWHR